MASPATLESQEGHPAATYDFSMYEKSPSQWSSQSQQYGYASQLAKHNATCAIQYGYACQSGAMSRSST